MKHIIAVTIVTATLLAAAGSKAATEKEALPVLPPLNEPATGLLLPGKFVWSDLFTVDVASARSFYTGLFGWQWKSISDHPRPYGIFYSDGIAVAGLTNREPPKEGGPRGTWVHYASVPDVAAAEAEFAQRGGRTLLGRRSMPDRGEFAIVADPAGAIVGVMRSSSGDPEDYRALVGEYMWFELFTRDLDQSADFYRTLFGYEVQEQEDTPDVVDYILAADGYARAGVGSLPEESKGAPTWLGYVRVEDVAATVARAVDLGGRVLLEPNPETLEGGLAIIADPDGAPVGLLKWTYAEEAQP